ncbi:ABC transporter substrate-binding protein [Cryptosporangium aurantiacum]|uniref:ABC-type transport system, substrate-binding protein n=1 Tax=Cryptosporangium aurantiacum TaxID=134849 RepID=A0A1M7HB28_9ACTN|nr:ABC transporter substrate-binding protein [Cryptosporangium aurantiacum]SHM25618.1 ABC-type transport system, substrate-binding protein [Cryptosporangium aurantiacum]
MRKFPPTAAALVLALTLTACSGNGQNSDTATETAQVAPGLIAKADPGFASGGRLDVQVDYDSAEINGLDPASAETARSWMLFSLVYETLTTVDEKFQVKPGLAASWTQPDDTHYVFTLRPDATFSNGRAVGAADVKGSLDRMLEGTGSWRSQLGPVKSIDVTGAREVTVTLASPWTPFLTALAHAQTAILPMKELTAKSFDPKTTMLGSGPLTLTKHQQDRSWDFGINKANPAAAKLGFSGLHVDVVPDENNRMAALRQGSTDLAVLNSLDADRLLSGSKNITVVGQNNSDYYVLMQNENDPKSPLADAKVRAAINAAIDRKQLLDVALAERGQSTGVTPANLPGSCDPSKLPSATANDADIKAALKNVGTVSLLINSDPVDGRMAQVIQQQLEPYGVTVKIEQVDAATWNSKVYTAGPGNFQLALNWYAGYVEPSMITGWWNPKVAGWTASFLKDDPAIDALITKGRTTSGDGRAAVLQDLCDAVDQDAGMVPLTTRTTVLGYRTDAVSPTIQAQEGFGDFLRKLTEFRAAK